MVEPDFRKLSRGLAELIVKGKAGGLDVPQEIYDAAIEAWIDVFEPLVVALYAKGQADEREQIISELFVLPDRRLDVRRSRHLMLVFGDLIDRIRARGKRREKTGAKQ